MANFVSRFEKWGRRRCCFRPSWHYLTVIKLYTSLINRRLAQSHQLTSWYKPSRFLKYLVFLCIDNRLCEKIWNPNCIIKKNKEQWSFKHKVPWFFLTKLLRKVKQLKVHLNYLYLLTCSWHKKKPKPQIHQFTNLKCDKKP